MKTPVQTGVSMPEGVGLFIMALAIEKTFYAAFRGLCERLFEQFVARYLGICGNLIVKRFDILFHDYAQGVRQDAVVCQLFLVGYNECCEPFTTLYYN